MPMIPGQAMPAELAMLGGGFPEGMPMEAPPPEEMAPPDGPQSASDLLKAILALASDYGAQEQSQQNLLLVEKLRTIAQQILANEEKEDEGLMQGKFSPSALRRLAPGG